MPAAEFRIAVCALLTTCAVALGFAGSVRAETRVPASQSEISLSFAPVVKRAAPAVVNIYATRVVADRASPFAEDPFFSDFFRGFAQPIPRYENSLGSGVILDSSGIVVSNHHVVGNAAEIRIVLPDRREFAGAVILADAKADLVVIRLEGATDLPALEFAPEGSAEVGDLVLAIGNPFGVGQTVTSGIVSGLARSGSIAGGAGYFVQTDAAINPGNSGGALVDMQGRLLGVNTSILTRSGGSNGIGFAIPAALVEQYVIQAMAGRDKLQRPWAGLRVQPVDGEIAEALGQARPGGVLITQMHPQSPFAEAGFEIGDVITALDGQPVDAEAELAFRMTARGVGREAAVTVLRGGEPAQERMVALREAPDDPPLAPLRIAARTPFNGLIVAQINPRLINEMGLPLEARGVAVLDARDTPIRSGLARGDILIAINGHAVPDLSTLERVTAQPAPYWQIEMLRRGQRAVIRIRG